jgi:N-methylhydantoinase A
MTLDVEAAKRALDDKVAKPLGLELIKAAEGVLRIATPKMAHVVRWVTTERGLDAADFTLVAYGGAGPLHASAVARELAIAKVVIPRAPGHFSAYGMLVADLRRDFVNTWFTPLADAPFARIEEIYADMEVEGRETVTRGQSVSGTSTTRAADMRYVLQEHAVTVDLPVELFKNEDRDGIKQRFDAVHQTRYGFSVPDEKAEIVSLRGAVIGEMRKPAFEPIAKGATKPEDGAGRGGRKLALLLRFRRDLGDDPDHDRAAGADAEELADGRARLLRGQREAHQRLGAGDREHATERRFLSDFHARLPVLPASLFAAFPVHTLTPRVTIAAPPTG